MKKTMTVAEIREAHERRNSIEVCREWIEELNERMGVVLADNDAKDQRIAAQERLIEELRNQPSNGAVQPSKKRRLIKLKRPQGNRLWDWPHIQAMRQAYIEGKSPSVIARFYGSSRGHMTKILQNQAWYDPNYDPKARKKVEA